MIAALLLTLVSFAAADAPPDVAEFLRSLGVALAEGEPQPFLDKFDPAWSGYHQLHDDVIDLMARYQVGSVIEIVSDQGDEQKRTLELDWLLTIEGVEERRKIVKIMIEKQGKKWKIATLDPASLFTASRK